MEVLKTRCPSCSKLYAVDKKHVTSKKPQFECSSCHVRFAFDLVEFIESEAEEANSFLISWKKMPELIDDKIEPAHQLNAEDGEVCPKCEFVNPVDTSECSSCGVILARAREKSDGEFRSSLRTREQWERVLMNYEDEGRHKVFLRFCRQDNCLPFAAKKYQAILDADPSEDIALQMKGRIRVMAETDMVDSKTIRGLAPVLTKSNVFAALAFSAFSVLAINSIFAVGWIRSFGAVLCLAGLLYVFRRSLLNYFIR